MRCSEFREKMDAYIDGMLEKEEHEIMESHIESCESCRMEYEELSSIVSCLGEIEREELPSGFDEMLRSGLENAALEMEMGSRGENNAKTMFKSLALLAASIAVIAGSVGLYEEIKNENPYDQKIRMEQSEAEDKKEVSEYVLNENAADSFSAGSEEADEYSQEPKEALEKVQSDNTQVAKSLQIEGKKPETFEKADEKIEQNLADETAKENMKVTGFSVEEEQTHGIENERNDEENADKSSCEDKEAVTSVAAARTFEKPLEGMSDDAAEQAYGIAAGVDGLVDIEDISGEEISIFEDEILNIVIKGNSDLWDITYDEDFMEITRGTTLEGDFVISCIFKNTGESVFEAQKSGEDAQRCKVRLKVMKSN